MKDESFQGTFISQGTSCISIDVYRIRPHLGNVWCLRYKHKYIVPIYNWSTE
jgi:hypothetical protein